MKFISWLRVFIPLIVGLLLIWVSLLVYSFLLTKSDQKANAYIPNDANFVFKMNFKEFLKSSTYSLVFTSKDQQLLNSFEAFLNKQRKGTGKSNDYGIDYLSDFTMYGQKYGTGQVYVMILKLVNPLKFNKNLPAYLNHNQSYAQSGQFGVIVTYYGEIKVPHKKLMTYAKKVFDTNRKYDFDYETDELFRANLADYKVNDELVIGKGHISSSINDTLFSIDGHLELPFKGYNNRRWSLIPALSNNPLHIENSIFSRVMQDSIRAYMEKIGITAPRINHVSMNYYGVKMQFTDKTDLGVIITPIFDLIVTFEDRYHIDSVFKSAGELEKFGFTRVNNAVLAGNIKYKIREIDSATLYIGNNNELVIKRNNNVLMRVSGDLSKLTNFEGGGFIINAMLSSYPPYKASKDLFEGVRRIDMVVEPNGKKIEIKGKIKFHKDRYLFNDLLKFYLNMKGEY